MLTLVRILSILWLLITAYVGGLGLFMAALSFYGTNERGDRETRWRQGFVGVVLVGSGVLAVSLSFGSQATIGGAVADAALCTGVLWLLLIWMWAGRELMQRLPRFADALSSRWDHVRIPVRILFAAGFAILAVEAHDPLQRSVFATLAAGQIALLWWIGFLQWRHRDGR